MPYIARLYGIRKKIVPTQNARSSRPAVIRYAAPNGKAVLIQLRGRELTSSWPMVLTSAHPAAGGGGRGAPTPRAAGRGRRPYTRSPRSGRGRCAGR